jgi:rubrerythrin
MNNPNSPLPYPDTDGIIKAPMLVGKVASVRALEIDAISDHIYLSLIFEGSSPTLSELFEKLARNEMEHFLLLGKMTVALGGDPAIKIRPHGSIAAERGTKGVSSPCHMLKLTLDRERRMIENYEQLLSVFSGDHVARALLERIILDKEHYAKMLSRAVEE